MTDYVGIVEVGLRDGIQDEARIVPLAEKLQLVTALRLAGVRRLEVTSFVHPRRVPQMADAEEFVAALGTGFDSGLIGLVLNERGLQRAISTLIHEVNVVVLATETFSQRNQGMSVADAISTWELVANGAAAAGIRAGVTISAAWGCPFDGPVRPADVVELATTLASSGPTEISLADTIGAAVPSEVRSLVKAVASATGLPVRCHLHNTRSTGYANALAAIEGGASSLDASIGGVGGCPFAPRATGNVATEDLVELLTREGIDTGIDVDKLLLAVPLMRSAVDHDVPGQLSRAGRFRASRASDSFGSDGHV